MRNSRSYMNSWLDQQTHYHWMTVLPQLLSRVAHPDRRIFDFIVTIMIRVFTTYPDHALWSVLPLKRFRRKEICDQIRSLLESVVKSMAARFRSGGGQQAASAAQHEAEVQMRMRQDFIDNMLTLCVEAPPPTLNAKTRCYKMTKKNQKLIASLAKLAEVPARMPIVPLISSFTVQLPPNGLPDANSRGFSADLPRIVSFDDNIEVLKSKEKPKKISVRGSDGKLYTFLCKREDKGDMRKNSRLMEFASVINRLFRSDAQARRRPKLRLTTYGVFPMTEESGVIEWVPHTTAFRSILTDLYRQVGIEFDFGKIREMFDACVVHNAPDDPHGNRSGVRSRSLPAELRMFADLLRMFPPVFHRWFLQRFTDPSAWLEARTAFTASTASWSIVGAIVGLGDRHGENLLIDCVSGAMVQVDFDCLFDKGLELATPERVPFRLTQNMVVWNGTCLPFL